MLHTRDEARRLMQELGAATKGKLVLGGNTTGGMYLLPRVVRAFRERFPETEITIQVDATERLYDSALQNVLDMAIVGGPTADKRFGVEPICLDNVMLIVSPSHAFARSGRTTLKDLKSEPCILPQLGSRTRQLVERRLKSAGVTLNVVMQLPGTEAVKKAVEANLGVGFVSSFAVEREAALGDLRPIAIEGFQVTRHMEHIYRNQKYFSPVAQRFRDFVHEYGQGVTPISAAQGKSKVKSQKAKVKGKDGPRAGE
jgi:DNA-binding transcriptional LysR family regulator